MNIIDSFIPFGHWPSLIKAQRNVIISQSEKHLDKKFGINAKQIHKLRQIRLAILLGQMNGHPIKGGQRVAMTGICIKGRFSRDNVLCCTKS